MSGITIFNSVGDAVKAGFEILSIHPDSEGFLQARNRTPVGWAVALVSVRERVCLLS